MLITGASSGFGLATSTLLAERGYRVFGTSRKPTSNAPANFEMLQLDVNSDESVKACVEKLLEKAGHVDVLINNAGFALFGAIEETSLEEARLQLETNFFGVVKMVSAILPTMRKRGRGQIINIGSLAGHVAIPFQGYYAVTKFALEGFTEALRQETKALGIHVSIVEPGFFKTSLASAAKQTSNKINDYGETRKRVLTEIMKRDANGQDPHIVADTLIKIIESTEPKLHYAVGKDKSGLLFKRLLPQSIFEGQVRRMFKLDK